MNPLEIRLAKISLDIIKYNQVAVALNIADVLHYTTHVLYFQIVRKYFGKLEFCKRSCRWKLLQLQN